MPEGGRTWLYAGEGRTWIYAGEGTHLAICRKRDVLDYMPEGAAYLATCICRRGTVHNLHVYFIQRTVIVLHINQYKVLTFYYYRILWNISCVVVHSLISNISIVHYVKLY